MIHEVDEALRALVRRDVLDGTDVEVVFDAPTKDWAARRNTPTLDVYLYDIREDLKRRHAGMLEERDDDGRVIGRIPPPRIFKLSYLVTAWTQRAEDEHRLLSSVLACFLKNDTIPHEMLTGTLEALDPVVAVTIALPPPEDRSLSDVWSALGGELKPSLDVVVSTPILTGQSIPFGPPVRETPRFDVVSEGGVERTRGRSGTGADVATAETFEQDETRRLGKDDNPGRVFRVRGVPRQ